MARKPQETLLHLMLKSFSNGFVYSPAVFLLECQVSIVQGDVFNQAKKWAKTQGLLTW